MLYEVITKVIVLDHGLGDAGGEERCLVHQICKVSAGKARGAPRYPPEVYILGEGDLSGMHLQDLKPSFYIRLRDHDLSVEPSRPEKRRVKDVRTRITSYNVCYTKLLRRRPSI